MKNKVRAPVREGKHRTDTGFSPAFDGICSNSASLSNSVATFSRIPGQLFIHSIKKLEYAVLKASFLHMMTQGEKYWETGTITNGTTAVISQFCTKETRA